MIANINHFFLIQAIVSYFSVDAPDFRPYYEKENDFGRLATLFLLTAFFLAPLFIYFLSFIDVSEVYRNVGISFIVLLPVYVLIGYFFLKWRDKIIYFFWYHQFIIIYFVIVDLVNSQFEYLNVCCFLLIYGCAFVTLHRTLQLVFYAIFVAIMLTFTYVQTSSPMVSWYFLGGILSIFSFLRIVINFSRERIFRSIEDYSIYLRKTVDSISDGYVLSFFRNEALIIVDANNSAHEIFETFGEIFYLEQKLSAQLKLSDSQFLKIKVANENLEEKRVIVSGSRNIELTLRRVMLKKEPFLLISISDITSKIREQNELIRREEKYRNLYYKNQAGVFTLNRNGEIIDYNDSFYEMFDRTIYRGFILYGMNENEWSKIYDIVTTTNDLKNHQTNIKLQNGRMKWFIFNYYFDSKNNQIEGTVVDVSEEQISALALRESEEKHRLIYEESNDAIVLLQNDRIVDVNLKAKKLFGRNKRDLLKLNLFDLSNDLTGVNLMAYQKRKLKLKTSKNTRFNWFFSRDEEIIESEISFVELKYGGAVYHQCVIHDVTKQNNALRLLEQSEKSLKAILENNPEGIIILNQQNKVLYFNKEAKQLLGKDQVDINTLFIKREQLIFAELLSRAFSTREKQQHPFIVNSRENKKVIVDVTLVPTVFLETSSVLMILKDISVQMQLSKEVLRAELAEETTKTLQEEITQRINAEKELKNLFLKTKAIYESSSNTFLITTNLVNEITSYNSHLHNYFERLTKKKIQKGKNIADYFKLFYSTINLRYFESVLYQAKKGASRQIESKFSYKNEEFWLELFINPIRDIGGKVIEISLVAHDITEKKISEKEIKQSLREKEVLLKEIHHRVKNNLQVISSILNLQSSFIEDENTINVLQESRNRIHSMSIIHEDLYRTSDFGAIVFSEYLLKLATNLISIYRINEELVELDYDLERITLTLDQAVPCGLLLNELISNALKYAFPINKKGKISIGLHEVDTTIYLKISDNGIGLPSNYNIDRSETLGLQLVKTLVEQLDGNLMLKSDNGTEILISFARR